VVAPAALDAEVARFADKIAARSSAVIGLGKRKFYEQLEQGLEGAYANAGEAMACNLGFADSAEGMDAFLGKREASWKGR